jgi:hypothetical protein
MSEWLKEHAWKACVGETLPRVRIPLSPPIKLFYGLDFAASPDPVSNMSPHLPRTPGASSSSGCSHGGYSTTAEIYSPSGRSASSQSSGLSASTFLALNGESGDYTVDTRGTYQCSCIFGGTAGYGNTQHVTPRTPGDLVSVPPDYWQYVDLGNYLLRRTWQVLDQSGAPYNYGNITVNEAYSALTNGCNIVVSQGRGTTNSGGRFCDKYGNDTGISDPGCTTNPADSNPHNIQYCYSNPQCTSQFTQTISIVGFPFSHSVTYACTSVEISRP